MCHNGCLGEPSGVNALGGDIYRYEFGGWWLNPAGSFCGTRAPREWVDYRDGDCDDDVDDDDDDEVY